MLKRCALLCWVAMVAVAQQSPEMREILDRLAKLEDQNRQLTEEVKALKAKLGADESPVGSASDGAASAAPLVERVDVNAQRVAELEQTKVGAENKFPVTLTGMLLFNAYLNGQNSNGQQYPVVVPATGRATGAGATLRQTVIGLKLDGPKLVGGAKLTGSLYMDFFGGGTGLNQTMRLRVASLDASWKRASVGFAFDKPIMAPREPDSLAQVGVSPLTGAGNLWLWQPQVRTEYRTNRNARSGLRAQFGVYQTAEGANGVPTEYSSSLASARPGYQGRFEFWTGREVKRLEIAPGFHVSSSRVLGQSVPSRIFTVDWLIRPMARVEFEGTYFHGSNVGVVGGLRQGITIRDYTASAVHPIAVRAQGGWAQLKFHLTQRTTVNLFGGQEDDRNRDLVPGGVAKNQAYGGNVMYRWGPNVLTGFEASQLRTTYFGVTGTRTNPHYDLAIGYLF